MAEDNPKLFISYSWSSPEHEKWVVDLATELREAGIDVILDKWDLKEGYDAYKFMEKMVTDPKIQKVAIICNRIYAEKADERKGGVGTETQIISPEIYNKEDQNKFVAIVAERDENGNAYLPTYYKSRIYIDLSDSDIYATNFEQLLRWLYDKPLYIKPKIGKKPSFLSETNQIYLGTTTKYKRALDAIKNHKEYTKGAIHEYFQTFVKNLEEFRILSKDDEFDDKVVENIDKFLPYRNEAIEIFLAIAQYYDTPETRQQLHRFFESLIPYLDRPKGVTSWTESDFDNFRFIIHELFLYVISCLLKYECFDAVSYLLRQHYYIENMADYGKNVMVPFPVFREYMKSLEYRNKRKGLRRLSVRADLLEQRSKTSGIDFKKMMQADFILFIRFCLESMNENTFNSWWPETLLYIGRHSGPFELFARAQSKEYFNKLKCVFDIGKKENFEPLFEAFNNGKLKIPQWEFESFNPYVLLGYEQLATRL
ncbi:TIR domain-containing protein [Patescibacteria group bacterium]|nr:TIR domain-containing protein [Patescibacteria group bacterium]